MKTIKQLSIAALTLMLGACANDNMTPEPVGEGIPFSATITAGSATRALAESDDNLEVSWEKGEKVALIHNGLVEVMEVEIFDVMTKTAKIKGTITGNPANGDDVTVVYPASAVNTETKTVKTGLLATQDGTLTTIGKELDLCVSSGAKLSVGAGLVTLGGTVHLANQHAIVKFSLTKDGTNAINASQFVIKDGSNNVITTVTPNPAASTFFVAMAPASAATFNFEATVGSDAYTYSKVGATLAAGKYYQSPMTMALVKTPAEIGFANLTPSQIWSATSSDNTFTQTLNKNTGDATPTYSIDATTNTCGASIDAKTGKVTFTNAGSVTVIATVDNTETYTYTVKSVSYTLTVTPAAGSISYEEKEVKKYYGDSSFTNDLTKVGDGSVSYSSSNTQVATVNPSNGEVAIVGDGTTTITATVTDSTNYTYKTKTASYTVTITHKGAGGQQDYTIETPTDW